MIEGNGRVVDERIPYDPSKVLTFFSLGFVGILIVFCCSIVLIQLFLNGEANTESWAALTGLIGWSCGTAGTVYASRFGSTQQDATKNAIIAQQAKTAAVATNMAAAVTPAANGNGNGAPLVRDINMQVEGDVTVRKEP